MTQRYFATEEYWIMTGWDRPCQNFFLTIYDREAFDPGNDIVYSTLDDEFSDGYGGLPLDQIMAKMTQYGLTPPATLRDDLLADQAANRGDLRVTYPFLKESK
jgi:hypothetical protein